MALSVLAPDPAPGRPVLVAVRDVPAGAALQDDDVTLVRRPAADLPRQSVADPGAALGQVVSAPLRAGEVLTPSRLVGPGLLAGRPADDVAYPVRVADGAASALLRPGNRVDVLVAEAQAGSARTVARGATVLAVPGAGGSVAGAGGSAGSPGSEGLIGGAATDPGQGGLLLLAVSARTAADLAQAAAVGPLSFLIR